jgi:spoIIIJ-associated protein
VIREATATGRTVDAAIEAACEQLGLSREEVEIEIIDLPRRGFLGLSQTPAKVRAYMEQPEEPKKLEMAGRYVTDILRAMGLDDIRIQATQEETTIHIRLEGDVSGAAIGRRGETLDALQYLAGLAANRLKGDYVRVVLDSGNYRDKRRHTLEQLARRLANTVVRTGRSTTLEPMNPYERRIIHSTVSEIEGAVSTSVGEEPNRCVVISATNPRPQQTGRPAQERQTGRPQGAGAPRSGRPGGDGRRSSGGRGDRDRRGGRREKPEPYKESGKREVAPEEAADQPLYGKIEL